jgi:hypothetical protein
VARSMPLVKHVFWMTAVRGRSSPDEQNQNC